MIFVACLDNLGETKKIRDSRARAHQKIPPRDFFLVDLIHASHAFVLHFHARSIAPTTRVGRQASCSSCRVATCHGQSNSKFVVLCFQMVVWSSLERNSFIGSWNLATTALSVVVSGSSCSCPRTASAVRVFRYATESLSDL